MLLHQLLIIFDLLEGVCDKSRKNQVGTVQCTPTGRDKSRQRRSQAGKENIAVIFFSRIRCVDKIWGTPVKVPTRRNKGAQSLLVEGRYGDKAVARWHAATNEPVIADELQPICEETIEITDLMGQ